MDARKLLSTEELEKGLRMIKYFGAGLMNPDLDDPAVVSKLESRVILTMLATTNGNVEEAAKYLGLSPRQLHRKLSPIRDYVERIRSGDVKIDKKYEAAKVILDLTSRLMPGFEIKQEGLDKVVDEIVSLGPINLRELTNRLEEYRIHCLVEKSGGDLSRVAGEMGLSERTIKRWLQRNYKIAYGENGENKIYLSKKD